MTSAKHRPKATRPLSLQVRFDPQAQLYEAEGAFGLFLTAPTRTELEAELDVELAMLWREYAMADPGTLTEAAVRLRSELRAAFYQA